MATIRNAKNLEQYENRFSLIVEQKKASTSTTNLE